MKEMSGSGIFAANREDDTSQSNGANPTPNNKPELRIYQSVVPEPEDEAKIFGQVAEILSRRTLPEEDRAAYRAIARGIAGLCMLSNSNHEALNRYKLEFDKASDLQKESSDSKTREQALTDQLLHSQRALVKARDNNSDLRGLLTLVEKSKLDLESRLAGKVDEVERLRETVVSLESKVAFLEDSLADEEKQCAKAERKLETVVGDMTYRERKMVGFTLGLMIEKIKELGLERYMKEFEKVQPYRIAFEKRKAARVADEVGRSTSKQKFDE